jgi:PAS domain S-box-containing protein
MGLDLSSNELSPPTLSELIPGAAELDVIACINSGAEIKSLLKLHERSYQFLIRGVPELGCGHVYGVDITDLKKTQQRLIESKTFLQQVVDSCPSLIYVKDSAGRYIFANKAAAAFYGLDMKSLMWRTAEQLGVTGEVLTAQNAIETEVLTTQKEVLNHEELMIDASGEDHILHTVRRPLASYDVFDRQVLTVATDISELKSLQEELMHSRKMDAVGQLAGGIAHDFNNLLTGILGCTGILRLHTDRMPELLQVTETIETAAQRAGQLTQKMLGFARRGKHQNIPVDIHSTIEETLQLLRRTIQKNIKIEAKLCAQASHVLGDPTQLQQIVLNLAINARDAMTADIMGSDGGSLTIQTRHISAEEAGLRDPEKEYGMFLELAVSDTGCGMSSAIREKAFDPFFTTKPPGKGTGMGLAMVYGIVKNHDGFVKIDSMEGIGTTVSVIFPALDSPSVKAVKALPPRPISGRGRILVVDDHTIVRSITCKMLSSLGYSVATASDGIEAIEYYKNNYKQIDLVILDMVMPRMGARDCFRALQRICPHVRAVLSTGYVNNNAVQEILDEGLNGFLQKPYELIKLSEVVATILNADESELRISSHLNLISAQKAPH